MRAAVSPALRQLASSSRRILQSRAAAQLQRRSSTAAPPQLQQRTAAAAAAGGAPPGQQGAAAEADARQQHLAYQAAYFDKEVEPLRASITPAVEAKLARVAAAVPGLSADSRVLDAGAGEGALIPHLQASAGEGSWALVALACCCDAALCRQPAPGRAPLHGCVHMRACLPPPSPSRDPHLAQARGVRDILAVDVSPGMLAALQARVGPPPSGLGNEPGVRTWQGDVAALPAYQVRCRAAPMWSAGLLLQDAAAAAAAAATAGTSTAACWFHLAPWPLYLPPCLLPRPPRRAPLMPPSSTPSGATWRTSGSRCCAPASC